MTPSRSRPDPPDTRQLHAWLARIQAGDDSAWNELLPTFAGQLHQRASAMLRGFPRVARWEQTDDILNNAVVRLMRALREVRPGTVREFYGLASEQMRR